ncbi:MAG TPA: hypothetical protein VIY29_02015 [Ktedonobacteraceae bacterium]
MKTMNGRPEDAQRAIRQRTIEMLLFLAVSAVGIYAMGQGLTGLFEAGQSINILWLAVMGVAMIVLFAQMGRVHDSWPKRKARQRERANLPEVVQEQQVPPETYPNTY